MYVKRRKLGNGLYYLRELCVIFYELYEEWFGDLKFLLDLLFDFEILR